MSFLSDASRPTEAVPWAPQLPALWPLARMWAIFTRMERPASQEQEIITAFRDGLVTLRSKRRIEGYTFADQEIGYQGIESGDLVVHGMDAFAGAIGVSDSSGKASPVYCVLKAANVNVASERYYVWLFRHMADAQYIRALARGIRERSTEFKWPQIREIRVPVPPLEIQLGISKFLDRKTSEIGNLLQKKRRLIRLLKEKRAALITLAVTKGLNPSVPMKDSGIDWLGEIPAHWETRKVAHSFGLIGSGTTPDSEESQWYGGDIPWVQTGELRESTVFETEKYLTDDAAREFPALKVFPAGSLLLAMYGATIGRVGLLGVQATMNQACCGLALGTFLDERFLFYWLWGLRDAVVSLASGGGQPNISQGKIRELRVPAPDRDEQASIVAFLDNTMKEFTAPLSTLGAGILKLKEYRTALITAAVTGQIDVREEVA